MGERKNMRRKLLGIFILGMILLSGCGKEERELQNNANQGDDKIKESIIIEKETSVKSETVTSTVMNYTIPETKKDPNLEYVEGVYKKFANILSNNKYCLEVSENIKIDENFYRIPLYYKSNLNTSLPKNSEMIGSGIRFSLNEEGIISKNLSVFFLNKTDNSVIKEFIKVTLMAIDSNINETQADDIVRHMVESTANSPRSDIAKAGEYNIFFKKEGGEITVYAIHNNEINKEVNKEEYKNYSADEMKASLNWGEKAYITVTPYSYTLELDQFMAKSDEGDNYLIYYYYNYFLKSFEIGKKYTLYGEILRPHGDTLRFRADYYEVNE